MSSKWSLEDAGDGFVRLKSEWSPTIYIHLEKLQNQAWYGTIEPSWWSAMWILEPIIVPTSIENLSVEKSAIVFPNPSNGDFSLTSSDFTSGEKVGITIFNMAGQIMYSGNYKVDEKGSIKIRLKPDAKLTLGNYYVVAKGKSGITTSKLLISR
jgi:hypothetical protein